MEAMNGGFMWRPRVTLGAVGRAYCGRLTAKTAEEVPRASLIALALGTACAVRGGEELLSDILTSAPLQERSWRRPCRPPELPREEGRT